MKTQAIISLLAVSTSLSLHASESPSAVLKTHAENWRYFDDGSGKAVYLVSSHTWMADLTSPGWPVGDWNLNKWNKHLDFAQHWNLNFVRMWMWEHDTKGEGIWMKTDSGKFDLDRLNQAYFDKLFSYVKEAKERKIFVGVMLFQGFSGALPFNKDNFKNWTLHPMNAGNNINKINGDPGHKGYGVEIHNAENKAILAYWKAYVRKMVDTLNGFDNILWEMGNEDPYPAFTKHLIDFIHTYEKSKPKQHLVWYSAGSGTGNAAIYSSNADVLGPETAGEWGKKSALHFKDPPAVSHLKPEILDNDHVGNHTTPATFTPLDQRNWAWKAFLRGYHPLHMDAYDSPKWYGVQPVANHPISGVTTSPLWDPQRKSLGDTRRFANKMKHLLNTRPTEDTNLCSTGYCLYADGREYLAYQPSASASITLDLAKGSYKAETFDTDDSSSETTEVSDWPGGKKTFQKPDHVKEDWVLRVFTEPHSAAKE